MARAFNVSVASGRGVADRWLERYRLEREGWLNTVTGSSKDIYDRLCALGKAPSPDAVADIIGNKSWTHLNCEGCDQAVERAVNTAGEYSSNPHYMCADCLREALRVLGTKG